VSVKIRMLIELLLSIQTILFAIFIYLYFDEKKRRERIYSEIMLILYDKITDYIDSRNIGDIIKILLKRK